MNKEILILNSRLTTFKFDDGREMTYNRVQFAYRDKKTSEDVIGFDKIVVCHLDKSSFDLTKDIKAYELVDAVVDFKDANDGKFKMIITEINGITV